LASQGRGGSFADDARRVAERQDGPENQQRRNAYRVNMRLPVHTDDPVQLFCEVVDISVLGVRFDRELPCTPGVTVDFRVEVPMYGAAKPDEIELQAEVVRLALYCTGLRFVNLEPEAEKAVRELVNAQQRRVLAVLREQEDRRMAPGMLRDDVEPE
jgi:hypothetical protein